MPGVSKLPFIAVFLLQLTSSFISCRHGKYSITDARALLIGRHGC